MNAQTQTTPVTTSAPVAATPLKVVVTNRRRVAFTDDMVISVLVEGNPKSRTAATRFAFYKDGLTVKEYKKAVGNDNLALRDLAWDSNPKQGWIKVALPAKAEPVAEAPAPVAEEPKVAAKPAKAKKASGKKAK